MTIQRSFNIKKSLSLLDMLQCLEVSKLSAMLQVSPPEYKPESSPCGRPWHHTTLSPYWRCENSLLQGFNCHLNVFN